MRGALLFLRLLFSFLFVFFLSGRKNDESEGTESNKIYIYEEKQGAKKIHVVWSFSFTSYACYFSNAILIFIHCTHIFFCGCVRAKCTHHAVGPGSVVVGGESDAYASRHLLSSGTSALGYLFPFTQSISSGALKGAMVLFTTRAPSFSSSALCRQSAVSVCLP